MVLLRQASDGLFQGPVLQQIINISTSVKTILGVFFMSLFVKKHRVPFPMAHSCQSLEKNGTSEGPKLSACIFVVLNNGSVATAAIRIHLWDHASL